jgi:hypothetical protein
VVIKSQAIKGVEMSESITIRHTTEADREALRRLAELDGRRSPDGHALAAFDGDGMIAAVGVEDRRVVADPFRNTVDVVRTMLLRAERERGDGSRNLFRWFALGHRMGRQGMAA